MNKKLQSIFKQALALFMVLCSVWGWGQVVTAYTGNFNNSTGASGSYSADVTVTLASQQWLASYAYHGSGEFRLGRNNDAYVPSKFMSSTSGSSIEMLWDISNVKSISFTNTKSYGTVANWYIFESIDSGANWQSVASGTYSVGTFSYTATTPKSSARYAFVITSAKVSDDPRTVLTTVTINTETVTSPFITMGSNSLSEFTYVEGNGPSPEQSFTVTGTNLSSDITATAPANWEVSATSGSGFSTTATLPASGGTVYTRLVSDLTVNPSYSGNIALTSSGATPLNVAVSGSVTPMPVIPVVTPSAQTGTVGIAFNYQIFATENPNSYVLASGSLPLGLTLDTTTGIISGTPTSAGTFTANITATNAAGTSAPAAIEITIGKGTQIAALNDINATVGASAITLPATTDAGLTITYSSNNTAVADVTGNTLSIGSVGSATITATAAETADYFAFTDDFMVTVNTAIVYTKISSLSELSDGEYVVVSDGTNAMNNTVSSNKLQTTVVTVNSNSIINPDDTIVWIIETDNANVKTLRNKASNTFVSGGGSNTNIALASTVSGNGQKWEASIINSLFRLTNQSQTSRALIYNGSVFGQYATSNGSGYFDLELYKKEAVPTLITWNGTAWSNTTGPDASMPAIIDGDYAGPAITAQSLTVNAGKTLTVNSYVSAGNVTNNGNIIVADGANFVQTGTFTAGAESSFKVRKDTKPVKRLAYINWSSPMNGSAQTLKQFSYGKKEDGTNQSATGTVDNRFFSYNNNAFVGVTATSTFNTGAGYLIRTPNDFTTTPQIFQAQFEGTTPNSGTISYDHSAIAGDFVMLGNPYPSSLSISDFLASNAGTTGTVYVWNSQAEMNESGQYTGTNYNTYSATGEVPVGSMNGYIPVGQAFFVERDGITNPFVFNNDMRRTSENGVFSKNATSDRFWLQLSNTTGSSSQMLIGFNNTASNQFDKGFDAVLLGSNADAIFTTVEDKNLVIDTHGAFTSDDNFVLNANLSKTGNYTLGVIKTDGVFSNGQQVWLKDLSTGVTTLISEQPYSFNAAAGIIKDRFVLQFKPGGTLATDSALKGNLTLFSSNGEVYAKANQNITGIEIYEMSGKLIAAVKSSQKEVSLRVAFKGVVVAKVTLVDGFVQTKKLMLK